MRSPTEETVVIPDVYIRKATVAYKKQIVFSQLDLHLPAGKWVALLGPSGIGKSTLLRLIAGLLNTQEIQNGEVYTNNHTALHQQIAYMHQEDLLLPWLNTLENVLVGFKLRHASAHTFNEQKNKAMKLLEAVGLGQALYLYPHQLSGGMRQRAALVRTLMEDKPIVLMDEPFSSLDTITRYKLQNIAAKLLENKTILFVTHDPAESLRLGHEIYIMQHSPALKHIVSLSSATPRELNHADIIQHQGLLFQALAATGEA